MIRHLRRYGALYVMLIIPMTILILFKYLPMYGVQKSFVKGVMVGSVKG